MFKLPLKPVEAAARFGRNHRCGAVIVLMVLLLPIAVLMSAIAINLAYIELSRTELIIATDAAARAGGRDLIKTSSLATARTRAQQLAQLNPVAGRPLQLSTSDLVFGTSLRSNNSRYQFTPNPVNPNALRVSSHRDSTNSDGPISLLMPSALGTSTISTAQVAISTQIEVDVGLVIDRSGSMAFMPSEVSGAALPPSAPLGWAWGDPAPPGCRWLDVNAAVGVFLNELSTSPGAELVSLSSYNDFALTNTSLTSNYASISAAMAVYTASYFNGGTNIGGGIVEGAAALRFSPGQRAGAAKVLVVMTDGIHNIGLDPLIAAQAAADDGIMIFTVTFSSEADQVRMQQVATLGNGRHYHAATPAQLTAVFADIASSLPTLLTE